GRVPVEAQAMGVPVITTNHGGARETVVNGTTGWLISPTNIGEYARAIGAALSLAPADKMAMATAGRENVIANFTTAKMGRETLDVYAELLA
ncbi:MAG TPA: glycosyltransferase, partial [Patescibacteria group bacterium]|nr:glycosyltransferase [Patescibacteria group bacterium]